MHISPIKSYRILFGFFIAGLMISLFYLWSEQLFQIVPPARADHWLPTIPQYLQRQKITLNSSMIIGTLTNFPVFISFTDANLKPTNAVPPGYVNPNTFDIVFATADHAPVLLPHERTTYDPATGAITAWVLIPSLSATTNEIYVYYGNTSITTSQSNPSAVWGPTGANYQGVWHLDELGACPVTFLDSTDLTPTGRHGTCFNAPTADTGQVNGARNFAGTAPPSDGINIPSFTLNPIFTYEAWVRPPSLVGFRAIFNNNGYTRWLGTNTIDLWFFDGSGFSWDDIMGGGQNKFHHIAFVADGTNIQFYHNGLRGIDPPDPRARTFGQITDTFSIGYSRGAVASNEYFAGRIDEVRVSNSARSTGWIQTSYNNQLNQGTFITVLPRQAGSRPLPPTLAEIPSFPNRYTPATTPTLGTFSTTDLEGDALEYEIQWDDDFGFSSPVVGTQNSSDHATNGFSAPTFSSNPPAMVFYDVGPTEPLLDGVIYWWRVRARDPGGSGLWSDYSSARSIVINIALPEEGWFQTSDAQFFTDALTNTVTTGTGGIKLIGL